ncbi:hypothetical protein AVEN_73037-1, partial [Araneus ventricosus]
MCRLVSFVNKCYVVYERYINTSARGDGQSDERDSTSICAMGLISEQMGISQSSATRNLRDSKWRSYKLQMLQYLTKDDLTRTKQHSQNIVPDVALNSGIHSEVALKRAVYCTEDNTLLKGVYTDSLVHSQDIVPDVVLNSGIHSEVAMRRAVYCAEDNTLLFSGQLRNGVYTMIAW